MTDYTFYQHLHNYAVWTAARAVQRNFTNTLNIKAAIEHAGLNEFVIKNNETITANEYDNHHRIFAHKIVECLNEMNIPCSYGRAAKIIAIYFKTSIILPSFGEGPLSAIIHPPIDSILLKNLRKNESMPELSRLKWTLLDENEYFELINKLRNIGYKKFWYIEKYWNPSQDE
jgi:hypothetical protein